MSAEVLREAALKIRDEWGGPWPARRHREHDFHLAVADWLDDIARWMDFGDSGGTRNVAHALAVARTYLGSEVTA